MNEQPYTHYPWPDAEPGESEATAAVCHPVEIESGYLASQLLQGYEVPACSSGAAGLRQLFRRWGWRAGEVEGWAKSQRLAG